MFCSLCRKILNNTDQCFKTSCGHVFHYYCVEQWQSRCPQCRSQNKESHKIFLSFKDLMEQNSKFETLLEESFQNGKNLMQKLEVSERKVSKLQQENNKQKKYVQEVEGKINWQCGETKKLQDFIKDILKTDGNSVTQEQLQKICNELEKQLQHSVKEKQMQCGGKKNQYVKNKITLNNGKKMSKTISTAAGGGGGLAAVAKEATASTTATLSIKEESKKPYVRKISKTAASGAVPKKALATLTTTVAEVQSPATMGLNEENQHENVKKNLEPKSTGAIPKKKITTAIAAEAAAAAATMTNNKENIQQNTNTTRIIIMGLNNINKNTNLTDRVVKLADQIQICCTPNDIDDIDIYADMSTLVVTFKTLDKKNQFLMNKKKLQYNPETQRITIKSYHCSIIQAF